MQAVIRAPRRATVRRGKKRLCKAGRSSAGSARSGTDVGSLGTRAFGPNVVRLPEPANSSPPMALGQVQGSGG
jgi:hypothetical protein